MSRTSSPTGSPSGSSTQASGFVPPVAPRAVIAAGDPHLTNVHGQRFDLTIPGVHILLQIPRAARPEHTLVRVDADAQALGGACAEVYFQAVNVTGAWAASAAGDAGGLSFSVAAPPNTHNTGWMAVGKIDLKVVWGHTSEGTRYLNIYARYLTKTGYPVGGLLGEDDHAKESTPAADCKATVALMFIPEV